VALTLRAPPALALPPLSDARTVLAIELPAPLPAPANEPPPELPALITPAIPRANASIVALEPAVMEVASPELSAVVDELASIVRAIALTAAAAPIATLLELALRENRSAAAPASAVIFVVSEAVSEISWSVPMVLVPVPLVSEPP
jgi:hypothetical protein